MLTCGLRKSWSLCDFPASNLETLSRKMGERMKRRINHAIKERAMQHIGGSTIIAAEW